MKVALSGVTLSFDGVGYVCKTRVCAKPPWVTLLRYVVEYKTSNKEPEEISEVYRNIYACISAISHDQCQQSPLPNSLGQYHDTRAG